MPNGLLLWDEVIRLLNTRYTIAQRCSSCQASLTLFYVPSLDMSICKVCDLYCGQCEYVSYNTT